MQSCSVLLGRPWEFDTDALHHGRTITYTFIHKNKSITLLPLSPMDIVKHAKEINNKHSIDIDKNNEISYMEVLYLLQLLLLLCYVIIQMHHDILCFVNLLCLVHCLLSLTFCRSLLIGKSRGRLQFKKGRMMRTSLR